MRGQISAAVAGLWLFVPAVQAQDLGPVPTFVEPDLERVELGQLLFYDPILSGNKNISCATCHHPELGTSDGLSLGIGEGGVGLGSERKITEDNTPEQRIPRNSPGLWNLGAMQFTTFFHDGRLEADPTQPNGIRTPLGTDMRPGFQSALAAQAMFPVLSPDEMAGHYSENEVSKAVRLGLLTQEGGAWDLIAARVAAIPEYSQRFEDIAPGEEITFTAIANVIADFIAFEWRADNSLLDRAMRGEETLPASAQLGMTLFYGEAGCSSCHSGWFQTDHSFHSIAMPQIGPGKAARFENHVRDDGRLRVTGDTEDAFAFRTPSLRNVTLTAPYGHSGAYAKLEDVVRHHLDPVAALRNYSVEKAELPGFHGAEDAQAMQDPAHVEAIAASNTLAPVSLSDDDVSAILSFLSTLEDPAVRLGVPKAVPSGLPVDQ
ncbi:MULTISPECIES: cytochrome-c peroxidase [unclassified Ruegeria]|uniref:cytochrome-c peroxidase n=1 Tax=unclassified Ruegeria TaxID=2625375 RepID=UPI001489CA9F|nr:MULTISPECIES: cytochrome c peroxidase [unclassified Ruegeria]NOD74945.1 cytochrome-c peroxidase [Ruegeria sp. HKCCD4332]NOD86906.1 cytochrome-c peroxidase [Ruegeria sp. HKCCD4318]NOE12461.1 cytochrome-c peroxidase [Ruegeria sp. HKCCD4318-2]NOG09374.1 cytochrome-c peroxidase [Ruegeria sp. HKCCD4315]